MIKTEAAYKRAIEKLNEDLDFIKSEKERLSQIGLTEEEIDTVIEPQITFHEQMKEEVRYYEKIKRGEFNPIHNLNDIGKMLIAYRIYIRMSQQELAARLHVSEAQVSRDERNEYYGATKERIQEVMQAMQMIAITQIEISTASA